MRETSQKALCQTLSREAAKRFFPFQYVKKEKLFDKASPSSNIKYSTLPAISALSIILSQPVDDLHQPGDLRFGYLLIGAQLLPFDPHRFIDERGEKDNGNGL